MKHISRLVPMLLLLAVSCQKNRTSEDVDGASNMINLSADVTTKGAITNTSNIREFRAFGYRQNNSAGENKLWADVSTTATADLMWNVSVNKNGDEWIYENPVSWDDNSFKRYAFFGYSPAASGMLTADNAVGNNIELLTSQSTQGCQRLKYETLPNVTQQVDLIMSSRIDQTPVQVVQMRFAHALTRVGFQAFTNIANTQLKSITISGVQYKGEVEINQPIAWSNVSADKTSFTVERTPPVAISTDEANPTDLTGGGQYYFVLLPQDLSGNTDTGTAITITYEQNGTEITKSYTIEENYQMGKSTLYKVNLSGAENEALVVTKVIVTDWTLGGVNDSSSADAELDMTIDATGQPANSYVTYPGRSLMFNATLKPRPEGGSISALTACTDVRSAEEGLNADIPLASIKRVEVSWQTAADHGEVGGADNMVIKSIAYDETTGICTVTPHAKGTGNAVISAYDAATGGNILWNWHIWVTNGKVGNAGSANGVTFMDRNLGALAATANKPAAANAYKHFGLMYQHGRPTPFAGQGSGTTINTYTKIYNASGVEITGGVGGFTKSNTAVSTVKAALETPNTFYDNGNTWYDFDDVSLWSDAPDVKSIYDPCPYGYRVPKNGSYNGLPSKEWTINTIDGGALWSNTWWPAAGNRTSNSGVLQYVGFGGWYWSSSRGNNAYQSCYLNFFYNGYVEPTYSHSRSNGMSVRCVSETPAPIVAPTVSLSNSAQADIPVAGGTYTIKVTSNTAWSASTTTADVTLIPSTGGAGETSVKIMIPANTGATRDIKVLFTATSNEGLSATATWTGSKEENSIIPRSVLVAAGWVDFKGSTGLQVAMRGDKQLPGTGTPAADDPKMSFKGGQTNTVGVESVTDFANAKFGMGKSSTDAMTAAGASSHPAAKYCREMGPEWYLPSVKELRLIYDNKGLFGHSYTFNDPSYWSSSEVHSYFSWTVYFVNGSPSENYKYYDFKVRCVREI